MSEIGARRQTLRGEAAGRVSMTGEQIAKLRKMIWDFAHDASGVLSAERDPDRADRYETLDAVERLEAELDRRLAATLASADDGPRNKTARCARCGREFVTRDDGADVTITPCPACRW